MAVIKIQPEVQYVPCSLSLRTLDWYIEFQVFPLLKIVII